MSRYTAETLSRPFQLGLSPDQSTTSLIDSNNDDGVWNANELDELLDTRIGWIGSLHFSPSVASHIQEFVFENKLVFDPEDVDDINDGDKGVGG